MTLSLTTLRITIPSIISLDTKYCFDVSVKLTVIIPCNVMQSFKVLSITMLSFIVLNIIMLSIIMRSIVMLSITMLSVVMLSFLMLSIVILWRLIQRE
jgi:hypothetical protein